MNFDKLLKWYFTENEGWEGVWKRNYSSLSRFTLEERMLFQKKIKRKFGTNMKREFRNNLMDSDYALRKIRKPRAGDMYAEPIILRNE